MKEHLIIRRNKLTGYWLLHILMTGIITGMVCMPASDLNAQNTSSQKKPLLTPQQFKEKLKGPILSAPTAFTSTFEVDYEGMEKVITHALDYGCRVVTLTSGNSRYDRLSYDEVKKLTRLVVETVGQKGVAIAATGNWSFDTVINYVRYAESIGASAIQVDPPKGSDLDSNINDVVRFYQEVARNTHLGIVLHGYYSEKLLKELIKIKSIIALKEDVADLNYYIDRLIVFGDRLAIFSGGSDARILFGYLYGSPAYFSVLYSYAPEIGLRFWKAIQSRNMKEAVEIATKYDIPFMKRWSFPFWQAAIEYLGGSQRYIRPKAGETLKQETLTEEERIQMQEFLCENGLKAPACKYCGVVTEGPALPQDLRRGGHAGGNINGNIIVAGGTDWSIDKTTKYWLKNSVVFNDGKWVAGPSLPRPLAYAMCASDQSGLYVAGGTEDGKSVSREVYQLASLAEGQGWKSLPQLPSAVGYGAGAILNGRFYVACGSIDTVKTNKMWVLDIHKPGSAWQECPAVPGVARMFPALVACGKYLYLLGGLAESSPLTPLKDSYRYDPVKNQWERLADLPLAGYAWVSAPVDDHHLVITGRAHGNVDKGIWIIDLDDMSMKQTGENIIQTTTTPLIKVGDKQWWLVGGEPDSNKNRTGKVSVISIK